MPTTKTIRIRVETGAGSTKYLCRSEGKVALVSSGYTHESISNLSPYAKHGRHAAEIVFALEDAEDSIDAVKALRIILVPTIGLHPY